MGDTDSIRVVTPDELDLGTAQTSGSERRAAIAPELGVVSALWGGTFEVEPGSRTGVHRHGNQETIAFVLSGSCEIRWGSNGQFSAHAGPGDFIHVPAWLPHMEINSSSERAFRWVASYAARQPRSWSNCRTPSGAELERQCPIRLQNGELR